jgi:serine-threonine kinase receptor-associated protein
MSKANELKFDDPITSMERSSGSLGELLTVTSGKKVYFIDLHK